MFQFDNVKTEVGNTDIMYVRIWGRLIPINQVDFVQVDPNNGEIEQDIPLSIIMQNLMRYNLEAFQKMKDDWTDL